MAGNSAEEEVWRKKVVYKTGLRQKQRMRNTEFAANTVTVTRPHLDI